jgi:hypothetical protein
VTPKEPFQRKLQRLLTPNPSKKKKRRRIFIDEKYEGSKEPSIALRPADSHKRRRPGVDLPINGSMEPKWGDLMES